MTLLYRLVVLLACLFVVGACSNSAEAPATATGTPSHAHSPGDGHKEGDKH